MKILGVGGGTLGPVTPLLATWKAIQRLHPEATLVWIGTSDGPEQSLLFGRGVQVDTLPVVKWPRYPSLRWLTFPFDWLRARRLAGELIDRHRPEHYRVDMQACFQEVLAEQRNRLTGQGAKG